MASITYIIAGFGFEVELNSTQGADAARRRAMWSLISAGHLEPEGSPEEMLAEFEIVSQSIRVTSHDRVDVA